MIISLRYLGAVLMRCLGRYSLKDTCFLVSQNRREIGYFTVKKNSSSGYFQVFGKHNKQTQDKIEVKIVDGGWVDAENQGLVVIITTLDKVFPYLTPGTTYSRKKLIELIESMKSTQS